MQFDISALNIPPIASPFFKDWISLQKNVSPQWIGWAEQLFEKGYVIIENAIDNDLADKTVSSIQHLYPNVKSEDPNRYQDLWQNNEQVKDIAVNPEIISFLDFAYGRTTIPFQTLNFKSGTEQDLHSDTVHFHSIPKKYMCGVWVALEDLDTSNGPLLYCEGSHKLREFDYFDLNIPFRNISYEFYDAYEDFVRKLVAAQGFVVKELHVKKGSALIWTANLIHGGKMILDKTRTRWSQVTHYYFDDCVYYTPMFSEDSCRRLYVREITSIRTGERVKNKIKGKEVELLKDGKERYWLVDEFYPGFYKSLKTESKKLLLDEILRSEKKIPLLLEIIKNRIPLLAKRN